MKTRQVLKLDDIGRHFTVVFKEGTNNNPYAIYEHTIEYDKYNFPRERKHVMVKYQNLESCLYWLIQTGLFKKDYFRQEA